MQLQIDDFNATALHINSEAYRPVLTDQIGFVQQDVMVLARNYGLNMLALKKVAIDGTGTTYQLDFSGPWTATAAFIEGFQARDALLGIRYLSFEQVNGTVQTIVQYKIYTKD